MWEGFFMKLDRKKLTLYITVAVLQIISILISVSIFSIIINVAEIDYKYSPVFGSISAGLSALVGALYLAKRKGNKGYLTGLALGGITFLFITLIGMIINDGGITVNTVFHLVIILLSGITGGIIGVNKNSKKYI